LELDELEAEGARDEDLVAPEADEAPVIGSDDVRPGLGGLVDELPRISPARRLVDRRRRLVPPGLVRSLLVEHTAPEVEGPLLGVEVGLGLGLRLEGQVHALVAAVLLRLARLDALDADAEAHPPDRERGQAAGAGRG